MKKVILLSSTLLAAPFMFGETGEASAQCTTSTDCATLGYTSSSNTGNCIKCPVGTTWYCPPATECNSCNGYTITTQAQADARCGYGSESCKNCAGITLWKCVSSSSSGGSSGGSSGTETCECPIGYSFNITSCPTVTSSCGKKCYQTAVNASVDEYTSCTNEYCEEGWVKGDCIHRTRNDPRGAWTESAVRGVTLGSASLYNCNSPNIRGVVNHMETVCGM